MTPDAFTKKWKASTLTERAASHSHFLDLSALLGEPTPTDSNPTGENLTNPRLRARGNQDHRRRMLGRCAEARLARLGIQGRAQRPESRPTHSSNNTPPRWKTCLCWSPTIAPNAKIE
jgi:hypothetical protein